MPSVVLPNFVSYTCVSLFYILTFWINHHMVTRSNRVKCSTLSHLYAFYIIFNITSRPPPSTSPSFLRLFEILPLLVQYPLFNCLAMFDVFLSHPYYSNSLTCHKSHLTVLCLNINTFVYPTKKTLYITVTNIKTSISARSRVNFHNPWCSSTAISMNDAIYRQIFRIIKSNPVLY